MEFHMDHYAISVSNAEVSRQFYEKLGFQLIKDFQERPDTVRILQMEKEGFLLEMFCYSDCKPTPEFVNDLTTDLKVNGAKHMALSVENLDLTAEYLVKNGLIRETPVINEGRLGRPYFFMKDPDGIFIELIQCR